MGVKNLLRRAARSIAQEAKEKLPGVVGEMSQQVLEAAPMWDQGWATRAQGNKTAREIHSAVAEAQPIAPAGQVEQKLDSIDMHLAALVKTNQEAVEIQKKSLVQPPKEKPVKKVVKVKAPPRRRRR